MSCHGPRQVGLWALPYLWGQVTTHLLSVCHRHKCFSQVTVHTLLLGPYLLPKERVRSEVVAVP